MKNRIFCYLVLILVVVACDNKMHHDGVVKQQIDFDKALETLSVYFYAACKKEMAPINPTEEQLQTCTVTSIGLFFKAITNGTQELTK